MAKDKTKKTEQGAAEKILELIQKYRKIIFIVLIAAITGLIASVVIFTVRNNMQESQLSKIDGYEDHFFELMEFDAMIYNQDVSWDRYSLVLELLDEVNDFQRSAFGFASARAHSLAADIYFFMENWSEAERSWLQAARGSRGTYFEPISIYNAAVAAEEQGNIAAAIEHFNSVILLENNFTSAARAQFNIGRLEESRGDYNAALTAYRSLLGRWPNDTQWANLAQSRIIALTN